MAVAAVDAAGIFAADDQSDFFCECGRPDCGTRVPLTVTAYAARRKAPGGAIVADGHKVHLRVLTARRQTFEARAEAAALRAQTERIHHVGYTFRS
jgi:hypothetical protein